MPSSAAANSWAAAATRPRVPQVHLLDTEVGRQLLVVDGSRLYGVSEGVARRFEEAMESGSRERVDALLES